MLSKYILVTSARTIHSGIKPCGHCEKARAENKKYFDSFKEAKYYLNDEKETKCCCFCLKDCE